MPALILPVRSVVQATPRTRVLLLDLQGQAFSYQAGQAVFAGLAGGPLRRPYSLASAPAQAATANALELLVEIDDHSAPDPHLERAAPGTLVSIDGPYGAFALPTSQPLRWLLLIAGGTGIAPLRSVLWDCLERRLTDQVTLLYSARSTSELAYQHELLTLAAEQRIALLLTVTREQPADPRVRHGRIDAETLARLGDLQQSTCLVCGPAAMVRDIAGSLRQLGAHPERIVTETYAAD